MQPSTDQFIRKTKTIETSPYCQAQALAGLRLAILSLLKRHKATYAPSIFCVSIYYIEMG